MYKKIIPFVMIIFFCVAWSNDPGVNTPVCTIRSSQWNPRIVSDGYGGAIIAWEDNRNSNRDIYAQLLDSTGKAEWTADGIPICTAIKRQKKIGIISDGAGGAIIIWQDKRSGSYDIYAQRVDHSGTKLWTNNGVPVCTAAGEQESPKIISDGAGGAIIAWQDRQIPGEMSIIAQRIDSTGNFLWTPGGEVIFNFDLEDDYWDEYFEIVPDGLGGAIIISMYYNWKAQRLNAGGTIQWQAGGVPIKGNVIASDGSGGAFIGGIGQEQMGYYSRDCVYAQHLDSNGMKLWAEDGIRVGCSSFSNHECLYGLRMIPDAQGGCILTYIHYWECFCSSTWGRNVCVDRVDSKGTIIWESGFTRTGSNPQLVPDGTGGVIGTWKEYREDEDEIYAQYIDAGGEKEWVPGGVRLSTVYEDHRTVSDDAGGCIVTWGHDDNIYAQNVCGSGALGDCNGPVAVINADRYGGIAPVTIQFDGSGSYDPDGSISLWQWDFGDGNTSSKKKVSRTYHNPGTYNVTLRVKDNSGNWSLKTQRKVMAFSMDDIDRVVMELNPSQVKAAGKGRVRVRAACFAKQTTGRILKEKPIPVDMGFDFTTTSGSWADEVSFSSGVYSRTLISGAVGTATVSAVLDGDIFKSETVEFAWPLPPANVTVELKENRSLLQGEYYAYLSWSENPQEVFTPDKYRVYRSIDGGAFELAGEIDAANFSYVDASLPTGHRYSYAVSMVDSDKDESSLSATVSANR